MPQTLDEIIALGIPRHSVQAGFLWSQYLVRSGNSSEALRGLDHLIDDIHFYRAALPGVLGDWYWTNRESVFSSYMEVMSGDSGDATGSLLALSEIRHIDYAGEMTPQPVQHQGRSFSDGYFVTAHRGVDRTRQPHGNDAFCDDFYRSSVECAGSHVSEWNSFHRHRLSPGSVARRGDGDKPSHAAGHRD